MTRQNRVLAVYKGEELLATGTADELAEHFGVDRKTVTYWTTPSNHKRNISGNKKVAVYADEGRLPLRRHETIELMHYFYKEKRIGISPKEIRIQLDLPNQTVTSQVTTILRHLIDLGFVKKIEGNGTTYIPTAKGSKYVEEFSEREVLV